MTKLSRDENRPVGGVEEKGAAKAKAPQPGKSTGAMDTSAKGQFAAVQPMMESAFGQDFSSVSVREGAEASAMGARAYAKGSEIVFAPGQADATTHEGRALFGHELVHVVQQRENLTREKRQNKGGVVNDPHLERQADELGERAARGERVYVGGGGGGLATSGIIQRKTESETSATESAAEEVEVADAAEQVQMATDARFVAIYLEKLEVDEKLKVHKAASDILHTKFKTWHKKNLLPEFVAKVRKLKVSGVLATILGTSNAWKYLIAVISKAARAKLYALLADGNIDARNAGRFTEDILEFWDVQMAQDAGSFSTSYKKLAAGKNPVVKAASGAHLVSTLGEYAALDKKYGMSGTLLSKFLTRVNKDIEVDAFLGTKWITQQSSVLQDVKQHLPSNLLSAYQKILAASNHETLKGSAPELLSVGGELADAALETADSLGILDKLASAQELLDHLSSLTSEKLKKECMRYLTKTRSKLAIVCEFIAKNWEKFTPLCGYALGFMAVKQIVGVLKKIDPARLGQFYLALVQLTAMTMFLPQLFAAYFLLPDKTRKKVFSALGRSSFRIIIREAKALIAPVLQDLINEHLPVGKGIYLERGLSVSARIARASGESKFSIIRESKDNIRYDERYEIGGGVGAGIGVGKTEGKKAGGKGGKGNKHFWGHEASANASAMAMMISQNRYSFPFMNDDAFIGFLAALIDIEAAVSVGAFFFDELKAIDPLPYLEKAKIEQKLQADGAVTARSGLRKGADGDTSGDAKHEWKDNERPEEMGSNGKVFGMFGANVEATLARMLELGASFEMEKTGDAHEISLQLGAKAAQTATVSIPGLGALSKLVPANIDAGAAIKVATKVEGVAEREPRMKGKWKTSLIGATGELDTYAGFGAEAEVEIENPTDIDSVADFVKSLKSAKFKVRVGIGSAFGKSFRAALENQKTLTSQLKKKSGQAGIKINASVTLEFELSRTKTQKVIQHLAQIYKDVSEADFEDFKKAAMDFLTSGRLPKSDALSGIGEILKSSLTETEYHLELGGGYAFGREVGQETQGGKTKKGGKGKGSANVQGQVGGGFIWHGTLEDALADFDAQSLLDLIAARPEELSKMAATLKLS